MKHNSRIRVLCSGDNLVIPSYGDNWTHWDSGAGCIPREKVEIRGSTVVGLAPNFAYEIDEDRLVKIREAEALLPEDVTLDYEDGKWVQRGEIGIERPFNPEDFVRSFYPEKTTTYDVFEDDFGNTQVVVVK